MPLEIRSFGGVAIASDGTATIGGGATYAQDAAAQVGIAQAWAEGTEPGGPETLSAREWADESQTFVSLAQEWAEGTEPGGAETQSAREWAEDAEASVAASVALQSAVLIRSMSGNHTAELADAGRLLVFDGTATLTIPAQADADWPVGAVIAAAQVGSAVLTVEGAVGVDLVFRAPALDVSVWRGGAVSLTRVAADQWLVLGDLEITT